MTEPPRSDTLIRNDSLPGSPGWADRHHQAIVFSLLWAVGTIAHVLRKTSPSEPAVWILIIAAVVLIAGPSSRLRLGMLASAYLLYFWTKIPLIGNHAHMMAFVNLGLLAALLADWIRRRHSGEEACPLPVRYIRLTVLLSYGAAAFAKLNSGFFDVGTSCAVGMCYKALAILGVVPGSLPSALEHVLPYWIAGVELLIPILLLVPGFRRVGLIVVVLFHLIMSFSPTSTAIDFTLVLLALVFLFIPESTATRIMGDARRMPDWLTRPVRANRTALFVVASFILAMALWSGKATFFGNRNWIILAWVTLVLAPLFLFYVITTPSIQFSLSIPSSEARPSAMLTAVFAFLVAVQLANISAPYLGSKNLGTFTMYSNLRTEGGVSNHFLIPRLPLKMSQDDLVEIVDSSSDWLCGIRDVGQVVSWHELRRILSLYPDVSITYRRDGVETRLDHAWEDPELVSRELIAHKFIGLRLFDPRNDTCRH